ncbi:MAG: hypothetical protein EAZ32_03670 [Cytophagia bacterium]|nr:MAG: hypothetical protein EAZ38_06465 [Cytophagales bacterium]TAG41217.1 MAG: hypothetical protein EAZ32_03670 [Cytophagia bacterium]TAG82902.1 MAG: hypothetical protein EAZ22_04040 [Cytophagales bacterium]
MEKLLKFKSGHFFLGLFIPWAISAFISDTLTNDIMSLIGYVFYFGFFMLSYDYMDAFTKADNLEKVVFFLINIILILLYGGIVIFFEEGSGLEIDGVWGLLSATTYFVFFAFIFVTLAKMLLLCEHKKVNFENLFQYIILFLILPVGIWILIPKFKKLHISTQY